MCRFGPTISADFANSTNSYLRYVTETRGDSPYFPDIASLVRLCSSGRYNDTDLSHTLCLTLDRRLNSSNITDDIVGGTGYTVGSLEDYYFAPRTCNQYWNPTVPISRTNVDSFYLGMASQRCEREDFIITPDLRGFVFGGLDHTRRDLMAQNLQRGRDHGLPDYNSARVAYGLSPLVSFEDLNPLYGSDQDITDNIERLRDVYNNDINQ